MTQALTDIQRLLPLLEVVFQAEQFKMGKINRRVQDLKKNLSDLDGQRDSLEQSITPAKRAGADVRWTGWVLDRKKLINQELAMAMVDLEASRVTMKAALSKLEAAKQVEAKARVEAKLTASRRASW